MSNKQPNLVSLIKKWAKEIRLKGWKITEDKITDTVPVNLPIGWISNTQFEIEIFNEYISLEFPPFDYEHELVISASDPNFFRKLDRILKAVEGFHSRQREFWDSEASLYKAITNEN